MRTDNNYKLGLADEQILLAINRFHYMTASQISRLLYPKCRDNNRYSQRRLKKLTDSEFILKLNDLPTPRYGSAPRIFTLARKGRKFLKKLGLDVPFYFRPSEEIEKSFNNPFIIHTLSAIDVLISVQSLCRDTNVQCLQMLSERELKRETVRVFVPTKGTDDGYYTTVIPDAWFQLAVGKRAPASISLELDRGTEEKKRWKRKVAALAHWAKGPYREEFDTDNITIAVVTINEFRRDKLREWTMRELKNHGLDDLNNIFLFTSVSPLKATPMEFFFDDIWYLPQNKQALSLLDQPINMAKHAHVLS